MNNDILSGKSELDVRSEVARLLSLLSTHQAGEPLRRLLELGGLNRSDLARRAGVTEERIAALGNGAVLTASEDYALRRAINAAIVENHAIPPSAEHRSLCLESMVDRMEAQRIRQQQRPRSDGNEGIL